MSERNDIVITGIVAFVAIGLLLILILPQSSAEDILIINTATNTTCQDITAICYDEENDIGTEIIEIRSDANPMIRETKNSTGSYTGLQMNAYAGNANIQIRRAQGTEASPTAMTNGNVIGVINFNGHDGTDFEQSSQLRVLTSQAWTTTAHGSDIEFRCVPNGTTTLMTCFTVENNADVTIGLNQRLRLTETGLTALRTFDFPDASSQVLTEDSALYKFFSKSSDPSTTDISSGYCATYKNTTSGIVKYWCNNAGTMVGIALS